MIDKIKIRTENIDSEFLLNNYKWKNVEIGNDPLKKGLQSNLINKSKKFSLRMLLTENLNTNTYSLSIDGSIRKWYFNANSRKDLKSIEFKDCIKLLGKKLGLKKGEVWKIFKITNLEIGVTLLLNSDFHEVMNCFVKLRNAKRNNNYESSIYFKFSNYEILIYDKFLEMNKGQTLTNTENNVFNKFHFFRFEISIKKMSGTTFKENYNTLELLKSNWLKLPVVLEKNLDKIVFVDLLSKEKEVKFDTLLEYNNYIKYLGMRSIGIIKTIEDFRKIKMKNNRNKYFNDLINNYRSHISSDRDYKGELMFELSKKTNRLI